MKQRSKPHLSAVQRSEQKGAKGYAVRPAETKEITRSRPRHLGNWTQHRESFSFSYGEGEALTRAEQLNEEAFSPYSATDERST